MSNIIHISFKNFIIKKDKINITNFDYGILINYIILTKDADRLKIDITLAKTHFATQVQVIII